MQRGKRPNCHESNHPVGQKVAQIFRRRQEGGMHGCRTDHLRRAEHDVQHKINHPGWPPAQPAEIRSAREADESCVLMELRDCHHPEEHSECGVQHDPVTLHCIWPRIAQQAGDADCANQQNEFPRTRARAPDRVD
jgi:hypothetical protein